MLHFYQTYVPNAIRSPGPWLELCGVWCGGFKMTLPISSRVISSALEQSCDDPILSETTLSDTANGSHEFTGTNTINTIKQLCILLTHWGRDKMAAVFQTTLSTVFSWKKINVILLIKISLKFVPKGPINNIPTLVQIMV